MFPSKGMAWQGQFVGRLVHQFSIVENQGYNVTEPLVQTEILQQILDG